MRLFQIALVLVLCWLQYQFWYGHHGYYEYSQIKEAVMEHQVLNVQLEKRNKMLLADVNDLRTGLEGVEERARNELGMIKQGEVFYRLLSSAPPTVNPTLKQ